MGSIASDASAVAARSGERPPVGGVYSIGAVASMLQVPPATLRTWEERYRVVVPERTNGGHRLYSRSHVEQLRFVADEVARGASAADAHRALEQRMLRDTPERGQRLESGPRILILIAERDEYSAEVIEFLLRTEGFAVEVALEADDARRRFELDRPELVIVEFLLGGDDGEALCRWLKASGAQRVLVVSELDAADRALRAGSDAFLRKPVGQLLLLSTVRDLLGRSAVLGRRD
jgi:DNA-binding transcriptional MerR regulator